ncbi:TGF-beta-activated kinase 1 and MAP3K7-binding protein 2 [Trebouxia sp. C0010 RCD-2024]
MNCMLQGSKSCCHLGCERAFAHTRFRTAFSRSTFGVAVRPNRSSSVKKRHLVCRIASTSEASTSVSASPPTYGPTQKGLPQSQVWELDFCSRPLLDERGKKRWELLICSPDREFEYSAYFPNNKINSTQLKAALINLLQQAGAEKPRRCRFFRGQMQTIISRSLTDLDIAPVPSRRCFTLISWLQERLENLYKKDPGYSDKAASLFTLDLQSPQELPDNLRGEQWNFVQLPLSALQEELKQVKQREVFGDTFDLETAGAAGLPPDALIPGVAVFSKRAVPLAAWTSGFELAALVADTDRACVILETGVNQRWRYGSYRRNPETNAEARQWEDAKKLVKGLHFLALQKDEEAEQCAGVWLLQDRESPSI